MKEFVPLFTSNPKELTFSSKLWYNQLKEFLSKEWKNKTLLLPNKLEFRPIDIKEYQEMPIVIAIDTETFAKNGNLICLCNSENENTLYGSVDSMPTIDQIFDYLRALQNNKKNVMFVAYNLKFDASILLKSLNQDLDRFYNEEFEITTESGIKIKYLNKKALTFRKKTNSIMIFDALQYFLGAGKTEDGKSSSKLDDVARTYLGEQKSYTGKYQDKKFPDKIEEKELKLIVEYCQKDCVLTKKIMEIWLQAFKANFKFYPDKLYSAGYVAIQVLRSKLKYFSVFRNIPYAVQDLAYNSYFGGRFEITAKGFMENIHHYDIRSAYPYAMSMMPDFNYGKWTKIYSVDEFKKHENEVGFYKIRVKVNEKDIAPFMFRESHGNVLTPQGEFITHTTSMELDKALKYYDIEIKKIVGYSFTPAYKDETEFNKLVKEMYVTRMKQTNEGQKYVYKVIINSLYGKFAQNKPEPKGIFNPVACSYVTGHTRSILLDSAKDNKKDIRMFATDGIFSTKKLNLSIGKDLGQFEYTFHPKFILLMAGIYSYNTETEKKMNVKNRGFGLRCFTEPDKNGDRKELIFDLDQYAIVEEKGEYYYKLINMRPVAISTALIQEKYTEENIGQMEFIDKKIDLNGDHKRNWFKKIKTVYDFSNSQTITLK